MKRIVKVMKKDNQMILPVTDEIKLNLGDQYYVSQSESGEIIFTPIHENIFSDPRFSGLDFSQSEIDFGDFLGREHLDD